LYWHLETFLTDFIHPLLGKVASSLGEFTFQGEDVPNLLRPYTLLHLLAANPAAATLPVVWSFDDVVSNGWVKREEIVRGLDPENRFLIVTEGSSDAKIIAHAFQLLRPQVADFFDFVDMQEGYPFLGVGNLKNFIKGLIGISVQNNVLILFDNDAEGKEAFQSCCSLHLPDNMRVLLLPDLEEFERFKSIGPNGPFEANINGKAAAIECYLDTHGSGIVRWNNFKKSLDIYQGELMEKDQYKREFLSQRAKSPDYDYTKLEQILSMLIHHCTAIKEAMLNRRLEFIHPL
jgi:hypothetical protein